MMSVGTPLRTPKTELTLSAGPEPLRQTDITLTLRHRAKYALQTRMLMVRYSVPRVMLTEGEARFAWGDR